MAGFVAQPLAAERQAIKNCNQSITDWMGHVGCFFISITHSESHLSCFLPIKKKESAQALKSMNNSVSNWKQNCCSLNNGLLANVCTWLPNFSWHQSADVQHRWHNYRPYVVLIYNYIWNAWLSAWHSCYQIRTQPHSNALNRKHASKYIIR